MCPVLSVPSVLLPLLSWEMCAGAEVALRQSSRLDDEVLALLSREMCAGAEYALRQS